jgi:hypothetical protein
MRAMAGRMGERCVRVRERKRGWVERKVRVSDRVR